LKKLQADDTFELVMFSNGSHVTLKNAQSTHEILDAVFPSDKVLSVDSVRAYKPSRTAYNHLLKSVHKMDHPEEVILISSNPFDICGAGAMNMKSLWINRSGSEWNDSLGSGPTWTAKGFSQLADFKA
jgi:2-haloacid dehalogenase